MSDQELIIDLANEITQLKLSIIVLEEHSSNKSHEIESLKNDLREIYAMRGEDPLIKRVCNRALSW